MRNKNAAYGIHTVNVGWLVLILWFVFEELINLSILFVFSTFPGVMADLCQLDNGGCSQVCYNLCNLKVQCGCWPGYTLAYDSKTCIGE